MPDVGRTPPDKNHTQSVLFYKDAGWKVASAKKWLKAHEYYSDGLDETDALLRFRQYQPDGGKYRYANKTIETKKGKPSIALVLAFKKTQEKSVEKPPESPIKTALQNLLLRIFPKNQAISMPNIYQLVAYELDKQAQADGTWRALIDVYLDGNDMYAVVAKEGLLYKSALSLSQGGVQLGDPVQVEVDYKPVSTQGKQLKVLRQADGKYRWFAFPAATAVLNRSGELDSRELFKNFVKRIHEDGSPYPFLSFYHVGEQIKLGQADFVAAEGYEYLVSGLFGDDVLSQAARKAIENHPDYYGISIGYYYLPEKQEKLEVDDGIQIPVYTDGINHEVSLLAERDAACLLTGIYTSKEGVTRMNKKTIDELYKLVGDDPEAKKLVEALSEKVDSVNTEIEDKNLVRRTGEETPSTTDAPAPTTETPTVPVTVTTVQAPAPAASQPEEYIMDEPTMEALATRVAEQVNASLSEQIVSLTNAIEAVKNDNATKYQAIADRVAKLEKPIEEQVKQALEDMPRTTKQLVYRPRERQAEQPDTQAEESLEEIANQTLANLPT